MYQLKLLTQADNLDDVRMLFREYATELNENLCFQDFELELDNPWKKYGEPLGCIVIAYNGEEPAGCVALQPRSEGVCEMKRLYVRPAHRKSGLGKILVERILEEAKTRGYASMVLDTLQRLQPAIRLYERYGFIHVGAYYENPLTNVVYMKKDLAV